MHRTTCIALAMMAAACSAASGDEVSPAAGQGPEVTEDALESGPQTPATVATDTCRTDGMVMATVSARASKRFVVLSGGKRWGNKAYLRLELVDEQDRSLSVAVYDIEARDGGWDLKAVSHRTGIGANDCPNGERECTIVEDRARISRERDGTITFTPVEGRSVVMLGDDPLTLTCNLSVFADFLQ